MEQELIELLGKRGYTFYRKDGNNTIFYFVYITGVECIADTVSNTYKFQAITNDMGFILKSNSYSNDIKDSKYFREVNKKFINAAVYLNTLCHEENYRHSDKIYNISNNEMFKVISETEDTIKYVYTTEEKHIFISVKKTDNKFKFTGDFMNYKLEMPGASPITNEKLFSRLFWRFLYLINES